MTIPQTPVFDGISPEECRRIYECFGVQERCFKPEELVYDFDSGRRTIGVLATGYNIVDIQAAKARPLWSGWISGETAPF